MNLVNPVRYVVITPVRDEAKYIEATIRSMLQQTVKPIQWLIVNDGSTDSTGELIERWSANQPWITCLHLAQQSDYRQGSADQAGAASTQVSMIRGMRAIQAKEIEAFYEGYARITVPNWDFLVKLDGDVGFAPDYFEMCFSEFESDPRLGVGGGVICNHSKDGFELEPTPHFHVRGATKIYRRACWEALGGVIRGAGWDTVDEVKANRLGWSSRSFSHLRVSHYRNTGSANGAWQNSIKNGIWSYIAGYHPAYMLLRCGKQFFQRPFLVASLGLLVGFLRGYIHDLPQIDDKLTIQYLREQQWLRMTLRKSIWK